MTPLHIDLTHKPTVADLRAVLARRRMTPTIRRVMDCAAPGVSDTAVLAAMEQTPRDLFTAQPFQDRAWENLALPIACGQTISQPICRR